MKQINYYNLLMASVYAALASAFLYTFSPYDFLLVEATTSGPLFLAFLGALYGVTYFLRRSFGRELKSAVLKDSIELQRRDHLSSAFPSGRARLDRAFHPYIITGFTLALVKMGLSRRIFSKGYPEPTGKAIALYMRNGDARYYEPDDIALLQPLDRFLSWYMWVGLIIFLICYIIYDYSHAGDKRITPMQ